MNKMDIVSVLVYQDTEESHPIANLNVLSVLNVVWLPLVLITSVLTHVLEIFVVLTLDVKLLVTMQFVNVLRDILVIHSPVVLQVRSLDIYVVDFKKLAKSLSFLQTIMETISNIAREFFFC